MQVLDEVPAYGDLRCIGVVRAISEGIFTRDGVADKKIADRVARTVAGAVSSPAASRVASTTTKSLPEPLIL